MFSKDMLRIARQIAMVNVFPSQMSWWVCNIRAVTFRCRERLAREKTCTVGLGHMVDIAKDKWHGGYATLEQLLVDVERD